jgi:hypothetical protein
MIFFSMSLNNNDQVLHNPYTKYIDSSIQDSTSTFYSHIYHLEQLWCKHRTVLFKFKIEKPCKIDDITSIVRGVNCHHWQYRVFNKLYEICWSEQSCAYVLEMHDKWISIFHGVIWFSVEKYDLKKILPPSIKGCQIFI